MNLCVNCKHHTISEDRNDHLCMVHQIIDPITGDELGDPCSDYRSDSGPCGPEAKLFQPKPMFHNSFDYPFLFGVIVGFAILLIAAIVKLAWFLTKS